MSNLTQHAIDELKLAGLFDKDSDYDGMIGEAVLELIEVFAKQGHSGHSAPMVASIFQKLANYQTLTPLTGEDSEWNNVSGLTDNTFQNNRNGAVFKDGKDGRAHYIDAIIWRTEKGTTWCGGARLSSPYQKAGTEPQIVRSVQYIKAFPFTPKKFVIDVIEEEVAKDDWVFHVKNPDDLKAVWEVYDDYKAK